MDSFENFCKDVYKTYGAFPQYLNTLQKILPTLQPVVEERPELLEKGALGDLVNPDRVIKFDVRWIDDDGVEQVNRGYRVQASNKLGPYKGGLRFHPSVNEDILRSLALEQILKNSLTTLDLGGAKGGADFDPKGKSDAEVQRFCEAFIRELDPYIGPDIDCPAGDIGVGGREIKYMVDEYIRLHPEKKIADALTGKVVADGGSYCRTQATGYGLVYFVHNYLEDQGDSFQGKNVLISGSGNVAIYAAEKCQQLGATVVTVSDSSGYVLDSEGINIELIKQIKEVERGRVSDYAEQVPSGEFIAGERSWKAVSKVGKRAIILPCATQNEVEVQDAKRLAESGALLVAEGSNLSTTAEAIKILCDAGVEYFPGKASNAGGVAVSGLEMLQNKAGEQWSFEAVDTRLQQIMQTIYLNLQSSNQDYQLNNDFLAAANIAGFKRLAAQSNFESSRKRFNSL